jgi:cytidylate kinase
MTGDAVNAPDPTAPDPTASDPLEDALLVDATLNRTVVAVDGPAGSGKSSVSRAAARALGFDYQDTGAAYRALSWFALESGVDTQDPATVTSLIEGFDYDIAIDPEETRVSVRGTDVTEAIREPRVSAVVSHVARVPEVRHYMVELFRSLMASSDKPGIVVEGRDITTVVAPDAQVRILLTASPEARMSRRSAETSTQSAAAVGESLASRDRADSQVVDFMNAADGVTTIDSTDIDFDQTVQAVVDLVHARTE